VGHELSQADKDRLHRLHNDSRALLESLADRLPEKELAQLRTWSKVGESALLVNNLCSDLIEDKIPVTSAERDALAAVLALFTTPADGYYLNHPERALAALTIAE
jgi:hypothetical protein